MTPQDPYARHLAFVAPAFARPDLWRLVCVVIGFEAAFMLTPVLLDSLTSNATAQTIREGTTPLATLMQFLAFGVSGGALVFLVQVFHGRGLDSLLGPRHATRATLFQVFAAVSIVLAVQEPAMLWLDRHVIAEMRDLARWMLWLTPGLVALLVQVGTEELFFRGYLQQQFAARSSSRWVWMVLPSLIFGLAHYANGLDSVDGAIWALWATLLGLACADLTARTGNLGAAIGLHLANNAFALLVVAVQDWPASGLALFLYPYQDPAEMALGLESLLEPWAILQCVLTALSVFVMWMAARLTLRR